MYNGCSLRRMYRKFEGDALMLDDAEVIRALVVYRTIGSSKLFRVTTYSDGNVEDASINPPSHILDMDVSRMI